MLSNPHYDPNQASLDEFEEEIGYEDLEEMPESDVQEMVEFVELAREEAELLEALGRMEVEERQCINCHDFFEVPQIDSDIDIRDLCEFCEDESEEGWS